MPVKTFQLKVFTGILQISLLLVSEKTAELVLYAIHIDLAFYPVDNVFYNIVGKINTQHFLYCLYRLLPKLFRKVLVVLYLVYYLVNFRFDIHF